MSPVDIFYQSHLPSVSLSRKQDKEDFISEILEINKSSLSGGPPFGEPTGNFYLC
jgi:hypothetical protein